MMHYINKCKHGVVLGQCRCPSPNKTVRTVGCPDACEEARTVSPAPRTWAVGNTPCPQCGHFTVIGYAFVNERDEFMHSFNVCTFWPSSNGGSTTRRCGWTGWSVP